MFTSPHKGNPPSCEWVVLGGVRQESLWIFPREEEWGEDRESSKQNFVDNVCPSIQPFISSLYHGIGSEVIKMNIVGLGSWQTLNKYLLN